MLHEYLILLGYNLIASKNIPILLKIRHFHKRPFWPTSSHLLINNEINNHDRTKIFWIYVLKTCANTIKSSFMTIL